MVRLLYEQGQKSQKMVQLHIMCWVIFIGYEVSFSGLAYGPAPIAHYVLFYLINISIFYLHSGFLFLYAPKSNKNKLWRIPVFVLMEMSLYCLLAICISAVISKFIYNVQYFAFLNLKYFIVTIYRAMSFVLYATGYYFLINYIHKREMNLIQDIENEKLKNDILRTEQDFLRAQINPHLLFNTLNFIKYAARKRPEEADEAVMRLSGIMGFALENNTETILVTKELEQVENIMALNQLRFNHTLYINLIKNIYDLEATIIPLVLLTLAENIFKHGSLLDEDHPAEIFIEATEEYLFIKTSNLPNRSNGIMSTNKGLANISSRMKQFYGKDYYFKHFLDGDFFIVEIKIKYSTN
jgi:two-component system LytT family sensor kinase